MSVRSLQRPLLTTGILLTTSVRCANRADPFGLSLQALVLHAIDAATQEICDSLLILVTGASIQGTAPSDVPYNILTASECVILVKVRAQADPP